MVTAIEERLNVDLATEAAPPRAEAIVSCPGSNLLKVKKLLVPVDFSRCSTQALRYAVQFAYEFGAVIDILYIVPPYYAADPYGVAELHKVEKELLAAGEQKLAALVLDQVPLGIPVETFVRIGRPATQIAEMARQLDTDLIVISTHGHTGIKHVVLGSTAENVVRLAPCPVLTVREKEHEFID